MKRYWKCWKCGSFVTTKEISPLVCTAPMIVRTSGICGGGFVELTEELYKLAKEVEKPLKQDKKVKS